jgi:hypothetical protein
MCGVVLPHYFGAQSDSREDSTAKHTNQSLRRIVEEEKGIVCSKEMGQGRNP